MRVATEFGTGNQFRVSNVLTRAWEVMSANFALFFAIGVLIGLPIAIVEMSYNPRGVLTPEAIQSGAVTQEYTNPCIILMTLSCGVLTILMPEKCADGIWPHL